jgi:hypothetical protein
VPGSLKHVNVYRTAEGGILTLEFPVKGNFRVLEVPIGKDIHDPLLLLHVNLVETEFGNVSLLDPGTLATGIEILKAGHGIGVKTNNVNHSEGRVFDNDWLAGLSAEHLRTTSSQRLANKLVLFFLICGTNFIPLDFPGPLTQGIGVLSHGHILEQVILRVDLLGEGRDRMEILLRQRDEGQDVNLIIVHNSGEFFFHEFFPRSLASGERLFNLIEGKIHGLVVHFHRKAPEGTRETL